MTDISPTTPYQLMGGKPVILDLVDRFYFHMDSLPEAETIRNLHAKNLNKAKEKLFKFLSGWLGGPDLFVEEYGHLRLRRRHFPFAIGELERDQWMLCMNKALAEIQIDQKIKNSLLESLGQLATHMINQP